MKEPRISDAEWEVMKVLWGHSPSTANEVVEQLEGVAKWTPKTIKTMLNRLLKKKALGFKKENKAYLYYPLVSEEECARAESKSFLERVYGGALDLMLASFFKEQTLSDKDIEELKRILDEKKK